MQRIKFEPKALILFRIRIVTPGSQTTLRPCGKLPLSSLESTSKLREEKALASSSETLKKQFANRVKTLRARKEMTASALARSAKVSPASVWQWEHAGAVPRKPTLEKLATLFDVSPDFLLTGSEITKIVPDARPACSSMPLDAVPLEDLIKAIQERGFRVNIETL